MYLRALCERLGAAEKSDEFAAACVPLRPTLEPYLTAGTVVHHSKFTWLMSALGQKRTFSEVCTMSAMCQNQTHAPQQIFIDNDGAILKTADESDRLYIDIDLIHLIANSWRQAY